MRHRNPKERRCTYVVAIAKENSGDETRDLASYLSTVALLDCDVLVLDASPRGVFLENGRSLRWVGRHVATTTVDHERMRLLHTVVERALCEKIIVATEDVRYTAAEIERMCE